MGIYLNPGNENYRETLNARIYVDKSMMIAAVEQLIADGNKYICVSRPRRFGKTIAGNMLAAYYSKGCDSSDLFKGLKISKTEGYGKLLNKCNVIQIDLNSEYQNASSKKQMLKELKRDIKKEMTESFSDVEFLRNDTVAKCIQKIYEATGEQFIILLDEYDVLVREQVPQELFDEYLSLLNGLFKSDTLKPAIRLAYLTGILPVVRDKIQSKLNNFMEYTILDAGELAEYIGFTADEVKALCDEYNMDYEECRRWYDGYAQNGFEIYNPESVVRSMEKRKYGSYWGRTSSYEVISDRIHQNYKGLKDSVIRMMGGESADINVTQFLNTMTSFKTKDDALTYLIHVGYLTYNEDDETCRIPNSEVRQEWKNAIAAEEEYETTNAIIQASKELLKETLAGNAEAVAASLDESHIHVCSNRSYNNEDALQSAIYLSFIYALNEYNCYKELTTGKGRMASGGRQFCADRSGSEEFADVVYVPVKPDKPAMIIELKRNDSAESAIKQIKEKKYFDSLSHYQGNLIFVGIDYDEKEKTHSCKIEKFVKE